MHDYASRAVDRLFRKLESKLKGNVRKLLYTASCPSDAYDEMFQESCMLFFKHFEEYYETDKQYLSFLFICVKNKIRNMQRKQINHSKRFTSSLPALKYHSQQGNSLGGSDAEASVSDQYNSTWNQVKDPKCKWNEANIAEIVTKAKKCLDRHQQEMFTLIVEEGYFVEEINEISQLRRVITPTPSQKSRLTILEKKEGIKGLNLKETVDYIEEELRPQLTHLQSVNTQDNLRWRL